MADMDRERAQQLLGASGLDGMVLFQPETFRYATGISAGVATMWGRAGSAIALVPADSTSRLAAVVSDHVFAGKGNLRQSIDLRSHRIWIDAVSLHETTSVSDINAAYRNSNNIGPRPETFDQQACFQLLADIIKERGLDHARLGVDLEFMPAADFAKLKKTIPTVNWQDASGIVKRLRMIKNPPEIQRLRNAASYAEAGLQLLAKSAKSGSSLKDLSTAWLTGATEAAIANGEVLSGHWDYISIGADLQNMAATVKDGDLIKADVGTLVCGYSSDGARTFVFGQPSPLASEVYKALLETFLIGVDALKPGNTFGQAHAVMLANMRKLGFEEYYRGHFGHSVGAAVGIEEWPFISHGNDITIEPNMVLALEAPFYANGLGALMIEEQFLITSTGAETMNRLSRELVSIV
ncbi:aminopeptidase P family protein [Rhizobium sp. CG4]|uniref:M24 family metallopeptidase n=1 Tax=Rhizobium/Agrobacterium group TaxID=227290 RepID=UPI0020343572|nr:MULTISPECIES: Xaa-Pro peptidase family protein [Rhizobium/Agrobacterium group]MCM2457977.1 aminopeptidase P family protein [Rhizobium sp. CG4]MDO5897062.1 Xaa-Pro peptidase family protein [Agrobacterium sp. Azo12]